MEQTKAGCRVHVEYILGLWCNDDLGCECLESTITQYLQQEGRRWPTCFVLFLGLWEHLTKHLSFPLKNVLYSGGLECVFEGTGFPI